MQGVIAVGLFADNPIPLTTTNGRRGLFKGGGWSLLGIQCTSALCLVCWGTGSTFLLLYIINRIVPIRMDPTDELMGADVMEHFIRHSQVGISRAVSALAPINHEVKGVNDMRGIGINPGHDNTLQQLKAADNKLRKWQSFVDQTGPVNIFHTSKKRKQTNHEDANARECKKLHSGSMFKEEFIYSPTHRSPIILNNLVNQQYIKKQSALISTISSQNINNDPQKEDNTNNMPKFAWVD